MNRPKDLEMRAIHRGKDMWVCLECVSEGPGVNDPREFSVRVMHRDDSGCLGPWMRTLLTKDEVAAWTEYRQFEAIAMGETR